MPPAKSLAAQLKTMDFPVLSHAEANEEIDGIIEITATPHVQVQLHNPGIFCAVRDEGENFYFYPDTSSVDTLAEQIRDSLLTEASKPLVVRGLSL